MRIQCTQDLLKRIPEAKMSEKEENAIFSWHAKRTVIGGKEAGVLVNNFTRYALVLFPLEAYAQFPDLFRQALAEALSAEGLSNTAIERYLDQAGPISYGPTGEASLRARLNSACRDLATFAEEEKQWNQLKATLYLNILPTKSYRMYFLPYEGIVNMILPFDIEEDASQQGTKAAVLIVDLLVPGERIRRFLTVPLECSFETLHKIIQSAFGWEEEHLHEFIIQDDIFGDMHINNEVTDRPFEFGSGYASENITKLDDVLKEYRELYYLYDFGDGWYHRIQALQMVERFPYNHAVCIGGVGTTPPEDSGGPYGYHEYLEYLEEEADEEEREFLDFAYPGMRGFNREAINMRLEEL